MRRDISIYFIRTSDPETLVQVASEDTLEITDLLVSRERVGVEGADFNLVNPLKTSVMRQVRAEIALLNAMEGSSLHLVKPGQVARLDASVEG